MADGHAPEFEAPERERPVTDRPELQPNRPEGHHKLDGAVVEGKTIHLGKSRFIDTLVRSRFVDCTIRIHCGASSLTIHQCEFERCTFWPAKEMRNLRLESNALHGCDVRGRFTGARFGANVADCDFSGAKVFDLCDFAVGANVNSCIFPGWPHVTLFAAHEHPAALAALPVGAELALTLEIVAEPPAIAACTVYVPAYEDEPDTVRELFETLAFART